MKDKDERLPIDKDAEDRKKQMKRLTKLNNESQKLRKIMKTKKHKVEIPEGHEVGCTVTGKSYDIDGVQMISTTITFKPSKKELPKTWEEYCKTNRSPNWLFNYDISKRYIALARLEILRDVYNDGWVPDWIDLDEDKYVIGFNRGARTTFDTITASDILAFRTPELRYEFHSNFSELIEQAKPLL